MSTKFSQFIEATSPGDFLNFEVSRDVKPAVNGKFYVVLDQKKPRVVKGPFDSFKEADDFRLHEPKLRPSSDDYYVAQWKDEWHDYRQVKESLTEAKDLFKDVDVIKLDPDRVDAYDIVSAIMPTLVRVAYTNLMQDKIKYDRNKDEEDKEFEFTKDALEEHLDDLIGHVRDRLDMSSHDRMSYINRIAGEFTEKLTEEIEVKFKKGDLVKFTNPLDQRMKGTYEGMEDSETAVVRCHKRDNPVMGVAEGKFLVPLDKIKKA